MKKLLLFLTLCLLLPLNLHAQTPSQYNGVQQSTLGTGVGAALSTASNTANGVVVLNSSGCIILPGATGPTFCLASNGTWTITTGSYSLSLSSTAGLTGIGP